MCKQLVKGVACYLSHAKTGGYAGALGLAEDTADAAAACRQVGPISLGVAYLVGYRKRLVAQAGQADDE